MKNVLGYVLRDDKVKEGYIDITGPFYYDEISCDNVYQAFRDEKRLWNKDSGRMYAHNIISFHQDEKVSPEECLEIGREFVDKFFPDHQNLIGVHQDKDHLHIHIVTNTVSYIDGMKLHQTKRDLEYQKKFTNQICRERGLSVTEKGKHFDGTSIEEGHVVAWNKDKYNLLLNETKKSFVAECAIAVLESREQCSSKEEFIERMDLRGWHTSWSDNRKHITFQNNNGDKVRDSNLEKSFHINASKEALLHEFERQNEILRLAKLKADRERAEQLDKYYREIDAAITGTGTDSQTISSDSELTDGVSKDKRIEREEDTETLIREVRADINDSRSQSRTVIRTENQSITDAEQRCIEEQQRLAVEKRARRFERSSYHHSEPSR